MTRVGEFSHPYVILTDTRTGGTFLALCLDMHPMICCWRAEPLGRKIIRRHTKLTDDQVLDIALGLHHCTASVGKITAPQVNDVVLDYLETNDVGIIRFKRAIVDCVISREVSRINAQPSHTDGGGLSRDRTKPFELEPVEMSPKRVVALCRYRLQREAMLDCHAERIARPTIEITYEECTDSPPNELAPAVTVRVCRFLGVEPKRLVSPIVRGNPYRRDQIVSNWEEVDNALSGAGLAPAVYSA